MKNLFESLGDREMLEKFFWWMNERHRIYLKRLEGSEPPWTDDRILQEYFFTNVFRFLDKTTVWVRKNIIDPHPVGGELVFNLCFARFTNRIPVLETVGWIDDFDPDKLESVVTSARDSGMTVFPVYMICGVGALGKGGKIHLMTHKVLPPLWEDRGLLFSLTEEKSLEFFCKRLAGHIGFGGFLSYEVACDLTYCSALEDAVDLYSWANPGPGAMRGIRLIWPWVYRKESGILAMRHLFKIRDSFLEDHMKESESTPKFQLRDIEHSLCEFSKYMRIYHDGKGRRYVSDSL